MNGQPSSTSHAHVPVLVREVVSFLVDRPEPVSRLVDGTVGSGGHALALLEALAARGIPPEETLYVGIDRDPEALDRAEPVLAAQPARVVLVRGRLSRLRELAREAGLEAADAILMDLGISTEQFFHATRGFGFQVDAPLDMRMDPDDPVQARDLVNSLPEEELANLLYRFGEERGSRRIARAIGRARQQQAIATTGQLAQVVARAVPRRGRLHPATRTFQALRVAVNAELDELQAGLEQALELLAPGGRLAVIAFHSLEDRIVKERLREAARQGTVTLCTRKVVKPGADEVRANRRARSARLRVAERCSGERVAA